MNHTSNISLINENPFVHKITEGTDVFSFCEWDVREVEIKGTDGEIIFQQQVEAPAHWSDQSVQIVASKYLYGDQKKGNNPEEGGRESSIKQLLWRVADAIAHAGWERDYFDDGEALLFRNHLLYLLLFQYGSFNSPVWFNVGLNRIYDITEKGGKKLHGYIPQGQWASKEGIYEVDPYVRPQASACFIIGIEDSIDGIWQLMSESARLFKYGSGVGADWSTLRSTQETISGGGIPSGPVSFMRVQDATGGTIKSGGKTRRAAIMQTLKCTHPDIMEFVNVKQDEERKAWALIEQGYDGSFNGPAYGSVAFQNVNQSVRVTDAFMGSLKLELPVYTLKGVDGNPIGTFERDSMMSSKKVLRAMAEGTWICGDPGIQYEDTIQKWHTCKNSGPINSSNPCSEYMFLDNSACNLASLNLVMFYEDGKINVKKLEFASRVFITAMDILVDYSAYPSREIALNSHDYRPLGLGFANLGALLMIMGLPYDSDEGRAIAAGITAIEHGTAYDQSAILASKMGAFTGYETNKKPMLKVMDLHLNAITPYADLSPMPAYLYNKAVEMLRSAKERGEEYGYRNSQVTVLAPTGTISFMMGCDTTGIEPMLGLVQYKKLAGQKDSVIKIVNDSVAKSLQTLGYLDQEIHEILLYIEENDSLYGCQQLMDEHLPVFATSFGSWNVLSWQSHLKMMAACQPFISGAISKTINMPHDATVEDIEQAYIMGWELGLKAVAIYRDGSKRSQPIEVKKDEPVTINPDDINMEELIDVLDRGHVIGGDGAPSEPQKKEIVEIFRPLRRKLPDERPSVTHKFSVGGVEGYIHVGLYPDTRKPGEVFITVSKQGSTMSGLLDAFATSISLNLQWGVPLSDLVEKFTHTRFEPQGFTSNPDIRQATSIIDYIFKWLGGADFSLPPEPIFDPPHFEELLVNAINTDEVLELKVSNGVMAVDAPPCSVCGSMTQRAGSCYSCNVCGNSTGCG